MDGVIRVAEPADAATIHHFIQLLATYEREPDAVEATPESIREQMESARPPFECLILDAPDARPVGFALYFQTYSTWRGRPGLHLEDLFVIPEYRGRGYGKALLERVCQVAVERKFPRVEWVVLDWNKPAIDFYDALGATHLSEWFIYRLTDDALQRVGAST